MDYTFVGVYSPKTVISMKQIFLSCILFWTLVFPTFSQDWNLVTAGGIYNFGAAGGPAVESTIRVDAALAVGADSVFNISPQRAITISAFPGAGIVGTFLGDTIMKRPDFTYVCKFKAVPFTFDTATRVIRTKAEIGDSWLFKTGITATVVQKRADVMFGMEDSIKVISLSNGDSMRLSKRFGLMSLGARNLIGLQDHATGIQVPTMEDFYADWIPGAVFEIYESKRSGSNSVHTRYYTWTKYYVLGKTVTPDSLLIEVHKLVRQDRYQSFFNTTELIDITYQNTNSVHVVLNPHQVFFPGGIKIDGLFYAYEYAPLGSGVKLTHQTLLTMSAYSSLLESYESSVGEKRYYYDSDISQIDRKLIGYQKLGQAQSGTVHPDSYFNVVTSTSQLFDSDQFSISPNPVTDGVLNVSCIDCSPLKKVEIIAPSGQTLLALNTPAASFSIPVHTLPTGLYYLRALTSAGRVIVRKVEIL